MFKFIHKMMLDYYRKQGLQLGDSSTILGRPKLGSEPFLISIGENVTITSNVTFITHDGGTRVFRDKNKYKNVIKFDVLSYMTILLLVIVQLLCQE